MKDDTLVISLPSIGNVSQLALDSIISTSSTLPDQQEDNARIRLIGYLDTNHIIPRVGNEVFHRKAQQDNGEATEMMQLCVGLEVYRSPANKITFVQQRSVNHPSQSLSSCLSRSHPSRMCIHVSIMHTYTHIQSSSLTWAWTILRF